MSPAPPIPRPLVVIFMGVAGSGKTTVGKFFAGGTGAAFHEGDDYHTPASVEKMRQGVPLNDEDRAPWLAKLREIVLRSLAAGELAVLTCSALKARYREQLQGGDPRVLFVHLTAPRELLARRLQQRSGHFLDPALLNNQLQILEPPRDAITINTEKSPKDVSIGLIQLILNSRRRKKFKKGPLKSSRLSQRQSLPGKTQSSPHPD